MNSVTSVGPSHPSPSPTSLPPPLASSRAELASSTLLPLRLARPCRIPTALAPSHSSSRAASSPRAEGLDLRVQIAGRSHLEQLASSPSGISLRCKCCLAFSLLVAVNLHVD